MEGWLTVKRAAEYCGVCERTLREWLKQGLRYSRVRRRILIKIEWLDHFLELNEVDERKTDAMIEEIVASVA